MKKLKIDENCTLKELRERFKENDDNCYVEIDGITLHRFSDVFSSNAEFLNLTLKEYAEYEELQKRLKHIKNQKNIDEELVNSISFNFYYQNVMKFMLSDKIEDFYRSCCEEDFFTFYQEKFILVAQILLAFEHKNDLDIYKEINKIIQEQLSLATPEANRRCITKRTLADERIKNALEFIKEYTIYSDYVDRIFSNGPYSEYIKYLDKKIESTSKKIDNIYKRVREK